MAEKVKYFEIRDRGTLILVLAVQYGAHSPREQKILQRAGLWGGGAYSLQLTDLVSGRTERDAYAWTGSRTKHEAHKYIEKNWDFLNSGEVIDIEYVLGEVHTPKQSEL